MERKDRESERLRVEVTVECNALGIKRTRFLNVSESKEFLATGRIPASAVAKSTFVSAKRVEALPDGSVCMCCGADLSGKPGVIVELKGTSFAGYKTVCIGEYESIVSGAAAETTPAESPDAEPEAMPETADEPTPTESEPVEENPAAPDSVEAALTALTEAIKAKTATTAPQTPPIDEAAVVEKAVNAARSAAKDEARDFMQKSVSDFIRDGMSAPAATGEGDAEPEAEAAPAAGDGVEFAANASSWSATATPKAVEAVEKLNAFLSEFSYFRAGVSMRLVNTFARAFDKSEALRSYCEVSQMEDRADLVEKMKSPEFGEVCAAFADFSPKPLNRRFAVFYGSPGGGKTYAAIDAGKGINGGDVDVVPCSPSMEAADMLYAYRLDYKTGKRGYVPTALLKAMTCGRAVVLDEINLLPMEARMFLQDILDNKGKVHLMGVEIPIRDGFFVIGTMNIETGLGASPLPLPLVDRAAVVREFKTSTAQAAVGAGLC